MPLLAAPGQGVLGSRGLEPSGMLEKGGRGCPPGERCQTAPEAGSAASEHSSHSRTYHFFTDGLFEKPFWKIAIIRSICP